MDCCSRKRAVLICLKVQEPQLFCPTAPWPPFTKCSSLCSRNDEGWGGSSVVEHLPGMHKTLGLTPSTRGKKETWKLSLELYVTYLTKAELQAGKHTHRRQQGINRKQMGQDNCLSCEQGFCLGDFTSHWHEKVAMWISYVLKSLAEKNIRFCP